ncbi:proline--tRNA ligase [Candidatus Saccharibacteria bacterium]|nr:proline--tRNA ligase [Candidatus Saccharibacteria bacterium]
MAYDKQLPKRSEDISGWYNTLMLQAELADYGPAKGTMILRPYGYAIWELVQKKLDAMFKANGVENAYFPLFIPESLLNKEKSHLEGFSPELAVVTIGGGEELQEKLIVRPTSETIMYASYSKWIKSWRDLPVMINQWNSAVRWEKRTYMFLRTTEFLWQEGHTAHASHEEAIATQKWAMDTYAKTFREAYAMPGYIGNKSSSETFAGASSTMTYETLMPGGKALQSATSHDLGQNFAKAFDVKFQSKEGQNEYVWQTSWGVSTRSLGGLFMIHGDDKGLRLPPELAPYQVVILPIRADDELNSFIAKISQNLIDAGIRVKIDDRDGESLGFKINKWEMKGAPIRLEIGAKELTTGQIKMVRRDNGEAMMVGVDTITDSIKDALDKIQTNLFNQAEQALIDNTHSSDNYEDFKKQMDTTKGFIKAYWCGNPACEEAIKAETTATTRCKTDSTTKGKCIYCGADNSDEWYFAQSY